MENFAIDNRPKFTFLGLQGYKGDDALMAIIVLFAADLTTRLIGNKIRLDNEHTEQNKPPKQINGDQLI